MAELFDQETDSSGDEKPNEEDQKSDSKNDADAAPKTTAPSNDTLFGDDDDSDDDDIGKSDNARDGDNPTSTTEHTEEETKEGEEGPSKDIVDSDEDDVEFEEEGITGRSRKTGDKPIMTADKTSAMNNDGGDDGTGAVEPQTYEPKDVTIPDLVPPELETIPDGVTFHTVSLPKIVAIQPEAFRPQVYNSQVEEAEYHGRVHNMIRWKYDEEDDGMPKRNEDGVPILQSNTRIIKWSDGTFGLAVGSELFDVEEILNNDDDVGEETKEVEGHMDSSKEYLYLLNQRDVDEDAEEDDNVNKTMLECVSSLKSKLIPRPSSLKSSAHKNFVLQERQRNLKRARIEEFVTFADPEKEKMDRIRNNDDLAKQQTRGGGTARRSMGGGGGRRRTGGRSYADEDEDEYDSVNIRKLKRGMRRNMDNDDDYSGEEEDNWSKEKRTEFENGRAIGRRAANQESSDEEEEFAMDEDDEDEVIVRKKASSSAGNKRSASLFDEDEDSD